MSIKLSFGKLGIQWEVKTGNPSATLTTLGVIVDERNRQQDKWGEQNHPTGFGSNPFSETLEAAAKAMCEKGVEDGTLTWRDILLEEVYELFNSDGVAHQFTEAVQVAAVATAIAEMLLRQHIESLPSVEDKAPTTKDPGGEQ